MSAEKIFDYDKLVEAYSSNLDVTLRGFRAADEMLDTWVPDEDPVRSFASLVEAVQLCGGDTVSIRVANQTLDAEASALVKKKLATLGDVVLAGEKESMMFTVSKLQETAAFRSVRPIYQMKLRDRIASLRFKRELKPQGDPISLRATEAHSSLSWAVRPDQHVILDAAFESSASGPIVAALDYLCEILVGLPVQEARDHAVVKLELMLRAPRQRHPVSGIILPHNADPLFRLPSLLVNRLFDDYRNASGYVPVMNFFDPGPQAQWKALSPEEREQRLAQAVAERGSALDLQDGDVQVVECKFPYAVTVRFGDRLGIPAKRALALALERLFRATCDPRLEVFCEEKKDLSKLRRLIEKANE